MSRSGLAPRTRHAVHAAALVALLLAVLAVGPGVSAPRSATAAVAPSPVLHLTPSHGLAGSAVTMIPIALTDKGNCSGLTYSFDAIDLGASPRPPVGSAAWPQSTVHVPAAATSGPHTFYAHCVDLRGALVLHPANFTVDPTPPPSTTTTTTTRPTTTTVTTPGRTTVPTTPGQTTTTVAGQTTTTTAPGDTTTVPDSTDTTIPPDTVPGSTATRSGASLKFDALAIAPGSAVKAIGQGCDADAPVDVSIDSATVARTAADASGEFQTPLAVSTLQVGRYEVTAVCGPTLTAPLDIVLASAVDQGTTTTMIIIVFFVLLGLIAFRRQLFPAPSAPAPAPPPDEVVDS